MASSDARCDESKCVSYALSNGPYGYYFTCYSDNLYYPMQCALGYTPRIVNAEPILTLFSGGQLEVLTKFGVLLLMNMFPISITRVVHQIYLRIISM